MTHQERFVRCLLGQPVDRPPFRLYWGPWNATWARWRREGMPSRLQSFEDVRREFGADPMPGIVQVNCGPCPSFERHVIEESDDSVTFTDSWGIIRRDLKHQESMSEFLRFPVRTWDDWEKFKAERLDPLHPDRLAGDWQEQCRQWMREGQVIQLAYYPDAGIFGPVRWLLGDEESLVAFCTMPELITAIMNHMCDLYLSVFARVVAAGVRVDVIHLWEDMCGRQGPLISPDQWEEFMGPCYRRIRDFAQRHGIPVISVDTDGRPDLIIPPMIRNGVNLLFPFEVAAGCDVNVYQRDYPALGKFGGIDKRELAKGPDAIDRELARIRLAVEKGRYIPDLDHGIPPDVSWDSFRHYAGELRRMVVG